MLCMSFNSTWSRSVHVFYQHSPDPQSQITFYIESMKLMSTVQLLGGRMTGMGEVDVCCPTAHGNRGHLIISHSARKSISINLDASVRLVH